MNLECTYGVSQVTSAAQTSSQSLLQQYSLQGHIEEVEKLASDRRHIMGRIALEGQATCIYAAPSTGKTLLSLHLLVEGVLTNGTDPARIFYVNMDDNPDGLVEKVRLAEEYGFHMVADGFRDFSIKRFQQAFRDMVERKQVNGSILILDTLKKFVDTMSKSETRNFTALVRRFVALGGTVVALAHTNKNPGVDGKLTYSGTTDVLDDFDCVYMLTKIDQQVDPTQTIVMFENRKSRGKVLLTAAYQYACGPDVSYAARLSSVEQVDPEQWRAYLPAAETSTDDDLIAAVCTAIRSGVTQKMALAREVSKQTGASRRRAVDVIERYAAPSSNQQRWRYTRRDRGAHHYELVEAAPTA